MKTSAVTLAIILGAGAITASCNSCSHDPLPPSDAGVGCFVNAEGGFCTDGLCRLIVPPNAVDELVLVSISETTAPAAVSADVVANRLCVVGPVDLSFNIPASLRIGYLNAEIPTGFSDNELQGFVLSDGALALNPAAPVDTAGMEVEVPTTGPIEAGISAVPETIDVALELGREVFDITDEASYYRNLSRYPFHAAFHDGTRFYLGNGPRVLVWNSGIPDDPSTPPDVIVGKPDLVADIATPSAANIVGKVVGLWADGTRLVVSAGHRVLIWNSIPTESFAPADIVLGQDGFSENLANGGGDPGPTTLFAPDDIVSDGTRLLVADSQNHRVLMWDTFPVLNNQPADRVLGQEDFDTGTPSAGAIPLSQPRGLYWDGTRLVLDSSFGCTCALGINGFPTVNNVAYDFTIGLLNTTKRVTPTAFTSPAGMSPFGVGGFALWDGAGARVSVWTSFPSAEDEAPSFVVGKPDATVGGTAFGGVTGASLTSNTVWNGVFADDTRLIVTDDTRALVWRTLPTASYTPADLVFGQPAFTTALKTIDYRGVSADTLAHPSDVSVAGTVTAIAERSNNRVLLLDTATLDPSGAVILGQPDDTGFVPNTDWGAPAADTLSAPSGVFTDGTRLVVADSGNHRVLIWNILPTTAGTPADVVLGHATFDTGAANDGAGDGDGDGDIDASATSLHYPSAVWIEGTSLFVADTHNNRVLIYDPVPITSGTGAVDVLGQPDMTSNEPNRGAGWFAPQPDGLAFPAGLAFLAPTTLLVADRENNRVVGFDAPTTSDDVADLVLGAPDLVTNAAPNHLSATGSNAGLARNDNQLAVDETTLRRPSGIAVASDRVYVADAGNHRVLAYNLPLVGGTEVASLVLGQIDFITRVVNAMGIGASSLHAPEGVWVTADALLVADTSNHRLLSYDLLGGPLASGTAADFLYGQVDFLGNGVNGSAGAIGTLDEPSGVSWDGTSLWVADRDHHRVVSYPGGLADAPSVPDIALGQVDLSRSLPNAGTPPSSMSMLEPTDVFSDGSRLFVADRGNHRVLIWNTLPGSTGTPADLVLGQADFDSGLPNSGAGVLFPSASSLFAPEAVHFENDTLYVADTGNNRVLIWDGVPTSNGAPADRVVCQPDFVSNLGNMGATVPDATTCSWPADTLVIDGALWVADSLNHRVLAFDVAAGAGDAAVLVLGQPDFSSRAPLNNLGLPDAATLNNPTGLAWDGVTLFVADRGNNRVLGWKGPPIMDGVDADVVVGQPTFTVNATNPAVTTLNRPTRLAVELFPFHETILWVADAAKTRAVAFEGIARVP